MPSRAARSTLDTGRARGEATWPRRSAPAPATRSMARRLGPAVGRDRLAAAATRTLERYAAALEWRITSRHAHLEHYRAYVDVQRVLRERPGRHA